MAIAEGIPINITLLFSASQYMAAANAYLNGIETRVNPHYSSAEELGLKIISAYYWKLGLIKITTNSDLEL
jgi:transaldolase